MIALITFLMAFGLSYAVTALLLRSTLAHRFLDLPNERSSHDAPKPRFGGIAIAAGLVGAYLFLAIVSPAARSYWALAVGGLLLFVTGIADDRRGLGVRVRFGVQIIVALLVVASGVVLKSFYLPAIGSIELSWLAIPLTFVFVLASINFYNFIDGIDGLAAGSGFIAAAFLSLVAFIVGHPELALLYLALSGATGGFLQFNFPPSRLFMGDSGSTLIGFSFAYLALVGNQLAPSITLFIPLLVLSSLYVDAGLTLINRLIRGDNVFEAHHSHYYQRLLSIGFNHKQITLLEYALVTALGISAVIYYKAGAFFTAFLALTWLLLFGALILKIRGLERGDRLFFERRSVLVICLDMLSMIVAFIGAYAIRTNFDFSDEEARTTLFKMLPIVLVVRSGTFYAYGLYRIVWKYFSTPDIVRVIKAVVMGSAINLTLAVVLFRFVAIPRTLFLIEFLLVLAFILGSRFLVRLFHEIGKESHASDTERIAIVGAGDGGERIGRELRARGKRGLKLICYVDDDPAKIGLVLQGAPIIGPISELRRIADENRIDRVVIGPDRVSLSQLDVARTVREAGLICSLNDSFTDSESTIDLGVTADLFDDGLQSFPGQKILIVGMSGRLMPATASLLSRYGADVTIAADPASGFRGSPDARIYHLRSFTLDACRAMIETVRPSLVIHAVALDLIPGANTENYLWDHVITDTEVIRRAVVGTDVERIVSVHDWGGISTGSYPARLSALGEAILLNDSALARVEIRVVRVSATRSLRDDDAVRELPVALLMAAIANPGDSGIVVGRDATMGDTPGPMYLSERAVAGKQDGLWTVMTPLYPADETLKRALDKDMTAGRAAQRREWVDVATAPLYDVLAARADSRTGN